MCISSTLLHVNIMRIVTGAQLTEISERELTCITSVTLERGSRKTTEPGGVICMCAEWITSMLSSAKFRLEEEKICTVREGAVR